jgi:DNA-directed RNA polymerase subunit M/transcription elongation factor TFIIS
MIRATCPNCGTKLKAPDEAAGRQTRCPKCGTTMTVPEAVVDMELLPESSSAVDLYGLDDAPPQKSAPEAPKQEGFRPCPMCGEMIPANAAKCRFCGEVFDKAVKKPKAKKKRKASAEDEDLSVGEWVLAILCSGIGCILGIIYMIQGKPKGKKLFGISLFVNVLLNFIAYIIRSSMKQP